MPLNKAFKLLISNDKFFSISQCTRASILSTNEQTLKHLHTHHMTGGSIHCMGSEQDSYHLHENFICRHSYISSRTVFIWVLHETSHFACSALSKGDTYQAVLNVHIIIVAYCTLNCLFDCACMPNFMIPFPVLVLLSCAICTVQDISDLSKSCKVALALLAWVITIIYTEAYAWGVLCSYSSLET